MTKVAHVEPIEIVRGSTDDPLDVNPSSALVADGIADSIVGEAKTDKFPDDALVRVRRVVEYVGPAGWIQQQLSTSLPLGTHTSGMPAGCSITVYQGKTVAVEDD